MSIIQDYPPRDGKQYDCQCARCGGSCESVECDHCEDGYSYHDCGEDCCMCADPEPNVRCDICRGYGHWLTCLSSKEWCEANPLQGREQIERGQIEWYEDKDDR